MGSVSSSPSAVAPTSIYLDINGHATEIDDNQTELFGHRAAYVFEQHRDEIESGSGSKPSRSFARSLATELLHVSGLMPAFAAYGSKSLPAAGAVARQVQVPKTEVPEAPQTPDFYSAFSAFSPLLASGKVSFEFKGKVTPLLQRYEGPDGVGVEVKFPGTKNKPGESGRLMFRNGELIREDNHNYPGKLETALSFVKLEWDAFTGTPEYRDLLIKMHGVTEEGPTNTPDEARIDLIIPVGRKIATATILRGPEKSRYTVKSPDGNRAVYRSIPNSWYDLSDKPVEERVRILASLAGASLPEGVGFVKLLDTEEGWSTLQPAERLVAEKFTSDQTKLSDEDVARLIGHSIF